MGRSVLNSKKISVDKIKAKVIDTEQLGCDNITSGDVHATQINCDELDVDNVMMIPTVPDLSTVTNPGNGELYFTTGDNKLKLHFAGIWYKSTAFTVV